MGICTNVDTICHLYWYLHQKKRTLGKSYVYGTLVKDMNLSSNLFLCCSSSKQPCVKREKVIANGLSGSWIACQFILQLSNLKNSALLICIIVAFNLIYIYLYKMVHRNFQKLEMVDISMDCSNNSNLTMSLICVEYWKIASFNYYIEKRNYILYL